MSYIKVRVVSRVGVEASIRSGHTSRSGLGPELESRLASGPESTIEVESRGQVDS